MSAHSTTHGGGAFPETQWTLICDLGHSPDKRRESLGELALLYWKPICLFLRQALRVEREASKDLTQAFFTWLLDAPVLERYDPARGPFRAFLKGVLRNFTRNRLDAERALKRGGGQRFARLDAIGFEDLPDPQATDPERAFDLAWVQELIRRATARAREQLQQAGKLDQLRAFEAYDLSPPGSQPTYASVAAELGLSERSVRHYCTKTRERVKSELRAELLDTVRSPEELDQEWRELLGS